MLRELRNFVDGDMLSFRCVEASGASLPYGFTYADGLVDGSTATLGASDSGSADDSSSENEFVRHGSTGP